MTRSGPSPDAPESAPLELWGGLECTLARIGDRWRDQFKETAHEARPDDLERIAALGVRRLRYPVLWERVTPSLGCEPDWSRSDERLAKLEALGIEPIVGLIHHGSGPAGTNLLDPDFPRLLAEHAARVAERYPAIAAYTPVNEPLTTARFACLYGHWYPHARSEREFLTALVHQCLATVLAMRAIRRVNPAATLVQTDDLGRVFSTPTLAYQEDYENERRWLTFDLLFGRVNRDHPFWPVLLEHGIGQNLLETFLEGDAPPDIVGINHYLTSDRYLDERLDRYPAHLAGGNAFTRYADVEAVRVDLPAAELGPAARLREAWNRYGAPIAVTEVHHGCTRDEQLRWLADVWRGAETVRREGADIRAVTIWSLFGAVDWNTLLTRDLGIYEPGAFDVRGPAPRQTALAQAAAQLASGSRLDHPVLDVPGWWRRPDHRYGRTPGDDRTQPRRPPRALLIVGPDSPVRRAVARLATLRGLAHRLAAPERAPSEPSADDRIWAVLDLTSVGPRNPAPAWADHAEVLAAWCGRHGRPFVTIAGGPVFPPRPGQPCSEADTIGDTPAADRERRLRAAAPDALAVRTGPIFGPWDLDPFVAPLLAAIAADRPATAPSGLVSPTYLPDLVHVTLDLLVDGANGVWHLANPAPVPGTELAGRLADRLGCVRTLVRAGDVGAIPPALTTDRGQLMPPLESALDRFVRDRAFTVEADTRLSIAAE